MNETLGEPTDLRDLAFLAAIVVLGLIVHWVRRNRPRQPRMDPGTAPPISEVLMSVWFLALGFGLAMILVPIARDWLPDSVPQGLIAGLALQLCLLAGAWQGRRWMANSGFRLPPILPEHPRRSGWLRSAGEGIIQLAAAFPLVLLVGVVWTLFLEVLRALGLPIPAEAQPSMEAFMQDLHWSSRLALIGLAIILAPIAEEVVFRGFLLPVLRARWPSLGAEWVVAIAFAAIHLHVGSFAPLVLLGFLFGRAYLTTGDIRIPIAFHAVFNLITLLRLYAAG